MVPSGRTGFAAKSATPCWCDLEFGSGACAAAYIAQLHIKVRRRKNYVDDGV